MKAVIGVDESKKKFSLDVGILADTRALVSASSGAGKSWLFRLLTEQIGDKIQTLIIDPEGEFPTLREKLDILIVGENGDIQPDIKSAGLLARKLAESGISAVIDICDLPGPGDPWDKRRLWVYGFLTGLMSIPKSQYHPMLVCIDEAHNLAPESPLKGGKELSKKYFNLFESPSVLSRSAIRFMQSAGRKRGIGGLLASQRISKIDKDSIADARNIFIGGTNLDIDQERAGDMLGMSKKQSVALRDLTAGEFYCFGPAFTGKGVFRFCAGQVETTHPKAGQRLNVAVPKASTQIAKIAAQFGDLPKEVEAEVKTLETLQNEVTRLNRELQARPRQIVPESVEVRVEVPVLTDEQVDGLKLATFALNGNAGALIDLGERAISQMRELHETINKFKAMPSPVPRLPALLPPKSINLHVLKNGERIFAIDKKMDEETITNPQQKILDAIAWFESIGIMEPRQEAVAFVAGYTFGGGAFNNPRSKLNTGGYVVYKGKGISLTDKGRGLAETPMIELTKEGLQAQVMNVLPNPHQDVLRALLNLYPHPVSKDELSGIVGRRGGAFNNPLSRLRTMGLIDYPERGTVKARSFLFLE